MATILIFDATKKTALAQARRANCTARARVLLWQHALCYDDPLAGHTPGDMITRITTLGFHCNPHGFGLTTTQPTHDDIATALTLAVERYLNAAAVLGRLTNEDPTTLAHRQKELTAFVTDVRSLCHEGVTIDDEEHYS